MVPQQPSPIPHNPFSSSTASSQGRIPFTWLNDPVPARVEPDVSRIYACSTCKTHFALASQIVSKTFQGHSGRAWLFSDVVNVLVGTTEERQMTTGVHTVQDIFCCGCGKACGWKYVRAEPPSQRYKEGVRLRLWLDSRTGFPKSVDSKSVGIEGRRMANEV